MLATAVSNAPSFGKNFEKRELNELWPFSSDCRDRVYLPSQDGGVETHEYLSRYVQREFPESPSGAASYSVPDTFEGGGERQARLAEGLVFTRLRGLQESSIAGLWVLFFHGASYAGRSFRNRRLGKLMIREHDFVIFAKHKGNHHIVLAEIKSTHDSGTPIGGLEVTSDSRVIKNNKRSAQHQLRDHLEILRAAVGDDAAVQSYIMWPFLGAATRDPRGRAARRWAEDGSLHVFEDTLGSPGKFEGWFGRVVLGGGAVEVERFEALLNRYIVLSCGVFVDEIHRGMLALLTQEQLRLLNNDLCKTPGKAPLVVHGAAGTGKTLLVLKKLQQLHQDGKLNENNRALYICYWPGIRLDMQLKLKALGIDQFVDTMRFFISLTGFLKSKGRKIYKHIFMDEAEAICLAFSEIISQNTINAIYQRYHDGNCKTTDCQNPNLSSHYDHQSKEEWGELWFMVDINQASLFLPKFSPNILKTPSVVLTKVMRSTVSIFNLFKQFYSVPMPLLPQNLLRNMNLSTISIGHHINGPPPFWINSEEISCPEPHRRFQYAIVRLVADLCGSKGFKPNEICVIPFLVNEQFILDTVNKEMDDLFVENGYRPNATGDVEEYLTNKKINDFLIAWALRVKGLEFKVVVMVFDEDDFDLQDAEDRKKTYIMASRCTCLLVLVAPRSVRNALDEKSVMKEYPFGLSF